MKTLKNFSGNRLTLSGILILMVLTLLFVSCKKFLNAKSNASLEVPSTLTDFQAIIDNEQMTNYYPIMGDVASDDYYVTTSSWSSATVNLRNTYVWDGNAVNDFDWQYPYLVIENANVILDGLKNLAIQASDISAANNIKGSALFFRAYAFYQVANIYALPFNATTSQTDLGVPLRLTSDITAKTTRSTIAQTYTQVINDLKASIPLLPVAPVVKSRPSKPAAYGALARAYLVTGDYKNANLYADSCLQLYSTLIDYNTVSATAAAPFSLFNAEVIIHAVSYGAALCSPTKAMVDTNLFATYAANDLRKTINYKAGTGKDHVFKGDYSGKNIGANFEGIATDEILLIRSETFARLGDVPNAIKDLNTLLLARFAKGTFTPYANSISADNALSLILQERRKELAFRGEIRWSDLKRLNQDSRFAKTLTRNINGTIYNLQPNDKKYAFLIPLSVVQITGIPQNNR